MTVCPRVVSRLAVLALALLLGIGAGCAAPIDVPGAAAPIDVPGAAVEQVSVPWRAGNAAAFEEGSRDEGGRQAPDGALPTTIIRPAGKGPFPFVVLLHGCGGLTAPAMWLKWVDPWASLFVAHGIGVAVVDSFSARGVAQVCRSRVAVWARRRADDAYSVRDWLSAQSFADPDRIAVMGMSNGGRTVLSALRADLRHGAPFRAGIALYPGCQSDTAARFDAPLLVFSGRGDRVVPATACEAMAANQPADAPLKLVLYPYAPHTFDMDLPNRTVLGMRLGYDPKATADARRQVIAFLKAQGIGF